MRQEGGTLISLLSDNEWETLYMRYLMVRRPLLSKPLRAAHTAVLSKGVVFEIFLTITVSAISTELLSDRLGFFPIAFGSAEVRHRSFATVCNAPELTVRGAVITACARCRSHDVRRSRRELDGVHHSGFCKSSRVDHVVDRSARVFRSPRRSPK